MTVSPALNVIHASEFKILDDLCSLATQFCRLDDFVRSQEHDVFTSPTKNAYIVAVAAGIRHALDAYKELLVQLSKQAQRDAQLTIIHLSVELREYPRLFDALLQLVGKLLENEASPPEYHEILTMLYRLSSQNAYSLLQKVISRLLMECHKVFAHQLLQWCCAAKVPSTKWLIIMQKENDWLNPEASVNEAGAPCYLGSVAKNQILLIGLYNQLLSQSPASQDGDFWRYIHEKLHPILVTENFDALRLEQAIECIQAEVSQRLWSYVVEKSNFVKYANLLHDVLLLARGELILAFIEAAIGTLDKPANKTTNDEMNKAFRTATASLYYGDKYSGVSFNVVPDEKQQYAWRNISVQLNIPKPIDLILTPTIFVRLNEVFRFLFRLRHLQVKLHDCWMLQNEMLRDKGKNLSHHNRIRLNQLRMLMVFLIDAIWYYLQVVIIGSGFSKLSFDVKSAKDFVNVCELVENFTDEISVDCFQRSAETIKGCISSLLDTCEDYAEIVSGCPDLDAEKVNFM